MSGKNNNLLDILNWFDILCQRKSQRQTIGFSIARDGWFLSSFRTRNNLGDASCTGCDISSVACPSYSRGKFPNLYVKIWKRSRCGCYNAPEAMTDNKKVVVSTSQHIDDNRIKCSMNFEYHASAPPITVVVACCFVLWWLGLFAIWVFLLALVVTFLWQPVLRIVGDSNPTCSGRSGRGPGHLVNTHLRQ